VDVVFGFGVVLWCCWGRVWSVWSISGAGRPGYFQQVGSCGEQVGQGTGAEEPVAVLVQAAIESVTELSFGSF
jgi:hypothetical protein